MRRKLLIATALLVVFVTIAILSTPMAVRWYVTKTYPFITLNGEISFHWGGVTFHDVVVSRPGLKGHLDNVLVNVEKDVKIEGGTLDVDLDTRRPSSTVKDSEGSTTITATGLSVHVKNKEMIATIEDVSIEGLNICFEHAKVVRKDIRLNVFDGCVRRDQSRGHAERIEIPIKIPYDIPHVKSEQTAVVFKAEIVIEDKLLKFASAQLGKFEIVGPATIKLSEDTVFIDAVGVNVNHPWVSPNTAHFKDLSITASVALLRGKKGKFRIRVGRAVVFLDLQHYSVDGDAGCNEWLDILPHPLPEALQNLEGHFSGNLNFEVRAKPTPNLKIHYDCKFKCSEEPIRSLRHGTFTYTAYNKDGHLFSRKTGPNSAGWVAIADLPPHIPKAFITLEDPGFYYHRGIHVQALENSLKMNLATGKFVRGGSTISMQLAKNLWLRRHKTVGRKAYEALLTVALESCLSKAQILELYMNVVEYGPDLYGIGPATQHYFHKPAEQLELDEAFYLASLLPHPKRAVPPNAGGLEHVHNLMQALANSGFISEHLVPVKDEGQLDTSGWEVDE